MARCLEAVSHTVGFGGEAAGPAGGPQQHRHCHHQHHEGQLQLARSVSVPSLPRPDSQHTGLGDGPADSTDSGAVAPGGIPCSPMKLDGGSRGGRLGGGGARGAAVASVGEDDRLTGHSGAVMSLACANGLLFSGGTDADIKVGVRPVGPHGRLRPAGCLPACPGLTRLLPPATAHLDLPQSALRPHTRPGPARRRHPQVWSLAASRCIATLEGHRGPIRKLEIVGGRLLSGDAPAGTAQQEASSRRLLAGRAAHRLVCSRGQSLILVGHVCEARRGAHPPSLPLKAAPCSTLPCRPPAAGAKFVRVWSLSEGFPCLAALQVADLRGSVKAIAAAGDVLYVGGQSCQVTAYKLASSLADGPYSPTVTGPAGQADSAAAGGAGGASSGAAGAPTPVVPPSPPNNLNAAARCGGPARPRSASATDGTVQACGGTSQETIRAMVGGAQPPDAASDPQHCHCGSITALAVCGPYVFSASTGGLPAACLCCTCAWRAKLSLLAFPCRCGAPAGHAAAQPP